MLKIGTIIYYWWEYKILENGLAYSQKVLTELVYELAIPFLVYTPKRN